MKMKPSFLRPRSVALMATALLQCLSLGNAAEHVINWTIPNPLFGQKELPSIYAKVGDTLIFAWTGPLPHNIWINPTKSCTNFSNAVILADALISPEPVRYVLTPADAGERVFVCTVPGHCEAGQILSVFVDAAPSLAGPPVFPAAGPNLPPGSPFAGPAPAPSPPVECDKFIQTWSAQFIPGVYHQALLGGTDEVHQYVNLETPIGIDIDMHISVFPYNKDDIVAGESLNFNFFGIAEDGFFPPQMGDVVWQANIEGITRFQDWTLKIRGNKTKRTFLEVYDTGKNDVFYWITFSYPSGCSGLQESPFEYLGTGLVQEQGVLTSRSGKI